ncbi:MAG TPA: PP0621 family protein [Noviherbaspirillum sp.]|jgi:uncharacterized protein|uniref:PP0621 family protein n=1 Tax=Noviherbaspirillum sp. TaxID=1926288 RepID=UPI002F944B0B
MRILLLVLFVVVVLYLLGRLRARGGAQQSQRSQQSPSRDSQPSRQQAADVEAMRQCAHCGAHFPESDAVFAPSGAVFCSEQHRLQHAGA